MNEEAKRLKDKSRYTYGDLLSILKLLRMPDGCPWDREQTHKSIRKNLIEETYEVIEAIDNEDDTLMREELGDLLMQIVFHATIAEEEGAFKMEDVVHDVSEKLVRRHPHIFGDVSAENSDAVLKNWDAIKATEKQRLSSADKMKAIPPSLPALMRADKISARAAKDDFDFPTLDSAIAKIHEEMREVAEAKTEEEVFEEVGDLIFSVVHYARKLGVDPEEALHFASEKFVARYAEMECEMEKNGIKMQKCDLNTKDFYWKIVKSNKK